MSDHGDLQGLSLQTEVSTIPTTNPFCDSNLIDLYPQTCPTLSPTSPETPPKQIEPSLSPPSPPQQSQFSPQSSPVDNLKQIMISPNIKGRLMEFCGKNKYELPNFKREAPRDGDYTTNLTWSAPSDGTHEPIVFTEEASAKTKKDAECSAASRMLDKIREYSLEHKVMEQGNFKGDLQQLISLHCSQFMMPNYTTSPHGIGIYTCNLVVGNSLGKDFVTTGRGVGKKTAEKEAAGKMLNIIRGILQTSPIQSDNSKDDCERLEARKNGSFPDYSIHYLPAKQEDPDTICLLKSYSLVLKREGFSSIVVASGSGTTDEEAKLVCAKLCLQQIIRLKEIMSTQQPK
ncbi:hypothetical protein LOD99_6980 [Oopsacas minuta]|uniref:DRBM domain-containing protein n=1 Tax=Oopsacas minuta TaxID=111878 RepID=A0AAV7JJP5_9METZ|nr:hypothetical protein LOD99_6980 [Oopsacas minuta]